MIDSSRGSAGRVPDSRYPAGGSAACPRHAAAMGVGSRLRPHRPRVATLTATGPGAPVAVRAINRVSVAIVTSPGPVKVLASAPPRVVVLVAW
jgi:hypothetical protein